MTYKENIISLLNSEIERNKEHFKTVLSQLEKNPQDEGIIADMNFMNGFISALIAVRDKAVFIEE